MKILKPFTKWLSKTGSENSQKTTTSSDYHPGFDISNYRTEIRKKENSLREEIKKRMNTVGHLPGSSAKKSTSFYNLNHSTITAKTLDNDVIIKSGDNGSMQVNVPLLVNGRDVMKELDEMRDALLLLKRDVDMEQKYPKLKEIKDEYERALEKYKTFDAIKDSK